MTVTGMYRMYNKGLFMIRHRLFLIVAIFEEGIYLYHYRRFDS